MEEEKKLVINRVKISTQKSALIVLIIMSIFLIVFGVILGIQYYSLAIGALFGGLGIICLLLAIFPVLKNVKLSVASNTYPESALVIYKHSIEIITDTTTKVNFSDIKSVKGMRFVGAGVFTYKIYYYGTLIIKLKDGKKITLPGIETVMEVAKHIKSQIKSN